MALGTRHNAPIEMIARLNDKHWPEAECRLLAARVKAGHLAVRIRSNITQE